VREVVDQYIGDSVQNSKIETTLGAFTQSALQQGANELLLGLLHQGFLVERPSEVAGTVAE